MPVESVYPDLEPLLPRVRKPIQYVGGEVGSVVKDWDGSDVRWALCYPDAYEVGLPNQGIQILYEVLNERDGVLAERTYTVWPDLEALMREHGVPQFTVDSHRPVGAFDVLGVSFATEMAYTNLLTVLDLAGIPLFLPNEPGLTPWSSREATPPSTPSRRRTSWTRWCSATASRPCSPSRTSFATGSEPGSQAAGMACCSGSQRWRTFLVSTTYPTILTAGFQK